MREHLKVGIIQPVINPDICWNHSDPIFVESEKRARRGIPYHLNIDPRSAERVWQEIQYGLNVLLIADSKPDIILIPELHLPVSKMTEIKEISKRHGVMIIAGIDFQPNPIAKNKIRNRGMITIPNKWPNDNLSSRLTTLYFGKTYFTYMERSMFRNIDGATCHEDPEQNMYIFKQKDLGSFGIMICSDIFDIERMMFYQARIHHLFIISLNKDLTTYFALSESLARLLFCNVVICNSGHFGGSVAISPLLDPNDRLIYKYQGQRMFNTHLISLPVESLDVAQKEDYSIERKNRKFKASPPGYFDKIQNV